MGATLKLGAPFVEASKGLSFLSFVILFEEATLITSQEEPRRRSRVVPLFQRVYFDMQASSGNETLDYFQYMPHSCKREVDA